jgi:hypothetical protein
VVAVAAVVGSVDRGGVEGFWMGPAGVSLSLLRTGVSTIILRKEH